MLEHLPEDVVKGLEAARLKDLRKRAKLRVQVGQAVFPVLRFWHEGFALDASLSPGALRGLVDIYEGPRHAFQCLIVASSIEKDELVCAFKRVTAVTDRAALDYVQRADAPVGYLPRA